MKLVTLLSVVGILGVTAASNAHFIWVTIDPTGKAADLQMAESPGQDIAPLLYKIQNRFAIKGLTGLKDSSDHLHMSASVNSKKEAVGIEVLYGLHGTSLVHFSAKGAPDLSSATKSLGMSAEILLKRVGHGWRAIVTKGGKPISAASVEIHISGKPEIASKSGPDGYVNLPTFKGMLSIGAFIQEPAKGTFRNQHYTEKLEACSLVVRT